MLGFSSAYWNVGGRRETLLLLFLSSWTIRDATAGPVPAQHLRRRLTGTAACGAQRGLMGRARPLAATFTWDGRHGLARCAARQGRPAHWLARRPDGVTALRDAVTVPPPRPLTAVWMWSAAGALRAAAAAWRRPTGEVELRRPAMPGVGRPRSLTVRTARSRRRTVPLWTAALGPRRSERRSAQCWGSSTRLPRIRIGRQPFGGSSHWLPWLPVGRWRGGGGRQVRLRPAVAARGSRAAPSRLRLTQRGRPRACGEALGWRRREQPGRAGQARLEGLSRKAPELSGRLLGISRVSRAGRGVGSPRWRAVAGRDEEPPAHRHHP